MASSTSTSSQMAVDSPDVVLRPVGVVLLGGIALIHFLDVFSKFEETPYQGVMFVALIAGCLVGAAMLIRSSDPRAWALAGLCGLVPFVMYIASRSVGLPGAADDIGNWSEPLGLASLATEALIVAISIYTLSKRR